MAKGKGGVFPWRWVVVLAVLCVAAYAALILMEGPTLAPDDAASFAPSSVTPAVKPHSTPVAPSLKTSVAPTAVTGATPLAYHETYKESPAPPTPSWASLRTHPVRMKGEPAKMAIILDDVGYDILAVERAMALGIPLTFSVLPNAPHGESLARRIHRAGFEVWLHLPMEPEGTANPGAGAILSSMTRNDVTGLMLDHLKAIPYIRGVNNHMGSRATARRDLMEWVLTPIRDHGLYFVDSKTTPRTEGFAAAKRLGVPCSIRDVFLDDTPEVPHTLEHLKKLEAKAEEQGTAIGIGHFYSSTLEALERHFAKRMPSAPRLVFASEIVELESTPLEP